VARWDIFRFEERVRRLCKRDDYDPVGNRLVEEVDQEHHDDVLHLYHDVPSLKQFLRGCGDQFDLQGFLPRKQVSLLILPSFAGDSRLDLWREGLEMEDFQLEVGFEEVVGELVQGQEFCRVVVGAVFVVGPIRGEGVVDPGKLEEQDSVF